MIHYGGRIPDTPAKKCANEGENCKCVGNVYYVLG